MASSRHARARTLALVAATLIAQVARARGEDDGAAKDKDPPLTSLEARVGYGIAFGGGAGGSVQRYSPLTITALVDHAIIVEPWTSFFGGVVVEGHGRGNAGVILGARVRPGRGRVRIAGGGIGMLVPATLFGPLASVGLCLPMLGALNVCGDGELALFVSGNDLPEDRIAGQAQFVLGVSFDAW